jgi:Protein of unknown function (DUF2867)
MAARAHRCEVSDRADDPQGADYASAFEVTIPKGDDRTPEQWARAVFEDTPATIRGFVAFGWRFVLRLRLGPRSTPDYVSGWRVQEARPDVIVLEVQSWLLTATKEIRIASGTLRMSTLVCYRRGLGRVIWTLAAPIHHRTEPYLLGYAASQRD